jgi:hypothetical protein
MSAISKVFAHIEWVIQTQERLSKAEAQVSFRDYRIEELLQEIHHLQDLLNTSHREKRELLESHDIRTDT